MVRLVWFLLLSGPDMHFLTDGLTDCFVPLVRSVDLPVVVSPIIVVRGLGRPRAAIGAYFRYFFQPRMMTLSSPRSFSSGQPIVVKNMPRHLLQAHSH